MQLFLTREPKRISVEHKTMRAPAEIPTAKPMWRSSTKKKNDEKTQGEEVAAVRKADQTDRSVKNWLEAIIIIINRCKSEDMHSER